MAGIRDRLNAFEEAELNKDKPRVETVKLTRCTICRMKISNFMKTSRFAGIPLSILYGLYVYYLLAFLILSRPESRTLQDVSLTKSDFNISNDFAEVECKIQIEKTSEQEGQYESIGNATDTLKWEHQVGMIAGGTVTISLTAASFVSKGTRCFMMLVVPGLFAKRGRGLLLTLATGFLIDGPIGSINYNLEQVIRSVTCMYTQVKSLVCRFQTTYSKVFKQVLDALKIVEENVKARLREVANEVDRLTGDAKRRALEEKQRLERQLNDLKNELKKVKDVVEAPGNILNAACNGVKSAFSAAGNWFKDTFSFLGRRRKRSGCGIPTVVPDVNIKPRGLDLSALKDFAKKLGIKADLDLFDLKLADIKGLLEKQSISSIREKLVNAIKYIFSQLETIFFYCKKLFYISSVVLLIYDGYKYMVNYLADDSFDNMYVDDNLSKLWKKETHEKLTPMRNWEKAEKYQVSKSVKLNKKEVQRVGLLSIPSMAFVLVASCIIVADFSLASFLDLLKDQGKYGISFPGMEQGLSFGKLIDEGQNIATIEIEAFDLSTDPCLPRPRITNRGRLAWLIAIMFVCMCSCLFDAYSARWRSQICNAFYPNRSVRRAKYLHRRIKAGRGNRRFQLRLVAIREKRKQEKLAEITITGRLKKCFSCLPFRKAKKAICNGCSFKVKQEDIQKRSLNDGDGKEISVDLCNDCLKDE